MNKKENDIITDLITNRFFWTYKKGDNVVYNFDILFALYKAKKHFHKNQVLYNKPIILTIIAIIECILNDFVERIQQRTRDPLNIDQKTINDIKYKKKGERMEIKSLKKFNHYIQQIEKHKLFGANKKIYEILHTLRDVRNRVHIQKSRYLETNYFTNKNLKNSEKMLEHVLKIMITKYPRQQLVNPKYKFNDFPFPWK